MYSLGDSGAELVINIISEFCHGFNIDEIAANGEMTADEIKVSMMVLCEMAGLIELPDMGEDL